MLIAQLDTAIDSFHAHHSKSANQRGRVLSFISERGGDWSIGEVAHALGLQNSTTSARINELLKTGELVAKAKRQDRRSGVLIRPVALPTTQLGLFN